MQDYQEKGLHVRIDEPATWDDMPGSRFIHYENATLSDVKEWLAEHGLVAMPREPTEAMVTRGAEVWWDHVGVEKAAGNIYKAMIAAQGESDDA